MLMTQVGIVDDGGDHRAVAVCDNLYQQIDITPVTMSPFARSLNFPSFADAHIIIGDICQSSQNCLFCSQILMSWSI
jgi:hypothetical protein